jgi:hypothetical protein
MAKPGASSSSTFLLVSVTLLGLSAGYALYEYLRLAETYVQAVLL